MTLVSELVESAARDDVPVATLLRQVKVVASRAAVVELDAWVSHELDGYPADVEVPSYRGPFKTEVLAHLAGSFGRELTNAPLPPAAFPESFRTGNLFNMVYSQPITELEILAASETDIAAPWPADAIAYTNGLIGNGTVALYDDLRLLTATQRLSRPHLVAVVAAVRNRVLDLALALEKLAPSAGMPGGEIPHTAGVRSIVNHIYGSANVAIGSEDVTQVAQHRVDVGDTRGLLQALRDLGVPADWVRDLQTALDEDGVEVSPEVQSQPGERVTGWLGRAASGVASISGTILTGTVAGLAVEVVKSYFGLGR